MLDPMGDPEWPTEHVYDDPEVFLHTVFSSQRCAIFVDESGDTIGRYGGEMNKLATKGRHWGHKCHFISQRAQQIDPSTRTQCSELFLFKSSLTDADILSKEYGEPALKDATKLQRGECLHTDGFKVCEKFSIF